MIVSQYKTGRVRFSKNESHFAMPVFSYFFRDNPDTASRGNAPTPSRKTMLTDERAPLSILLFSKEQLLHNPRI